MATKKKKKFQILSDTQKRIILLIAGSALTMLILAFSFLTINRCFEKDYIGASNYLVFVFAFIGIARTITYFKDKTKLNLIRCLILLFFNVAIGIIAIFARNNLYIFSLVAGLYVLTIIVSRAFSLIKHHKVRDIVFNALIITAMLLLFFGFLLPSDKEETITAIVAIECFIIAFSAFIEVTFSSFSQLKVKVLFKIIINTYALEVIFGLITMIIAFSLIIINYEENITNFPDALWYCFAVVTTIGFGDFVATSTVGRILTVILGIYGVFVVAILTSIIVNFYNETAGRKDSKELKEIKKEEEENKE